MKYLKITLFLFLISSYSTISQNKKIPQRLVMENQENDEKVLALGNSIEYVIINAEAENFLALLDRTGFKNNMLNSVFFRGNGISNSDLNSLIQGLGALPKKLSKEVESGSYYDLVNYRYDEDEKSYYILFRFFSTESGINYHDYKVSSVDGEMRFSDIFVYTTGEFLCDTYARLLTNSLSNSKKKRYKKNELSELIKINEAYKKLENGEPQKALKIINSVKGKIKKEKYYHVIKTQVLSYIDDVEYGKALEEMQELFPEDSKLYLIYMDYYILKENYDKVITMLNELEEQTSDDFLGYMKANIEVMRGDYKKAKEYLKPVAFDYNSFFEGSATYLVVLTHLNEFDTAVDYLDTLLEFEYDKDALVEFLEEKEADGSNETQPLVDSEVFINWKNAE